MKTIKYNDWPNCAINGCPNKACTVLDSKFCFPHTPDDDAVKHMKIEAHRTDMKHGTYIDSNSVEFED